MADKLEKFQREKRAERVKALRAAAAAENQDPTLLRNFSRKLQL